MCVIDSFLINLIGHDLSQGKQTINATTIYRYLNQRLLTIT